MADHSGALTRLVDDGAGLPFASATAALHDAVIRRRIAVVEAPPGTGKTTLGPPTVAGCVTGRVIVTQPRRVAVRAAARRLAELTGTRVGDLIGFTVRGERAVTPQTKIEMVTPGVLLRRLLRDPSLEGVGAVVLDEVHERGLDTDLLVGLLTEVRELRPDLVLVAMSATVDAAGFAAILGDDAPAPVVGVPAVLFPLSERWSPGSAPLGARGVTWEFLDHVAATVRTAFRERPDEGDLLVFLPGVREVRHVAGQLGLDAEVIELHGQVSPRAQDRAISGRRPGDRPRIIVSTALAESSLTVAGVRVVVDAGLSREPRRDAGRGMSGLVTVRCSRSSADQRAGRAARQGAGTVWRCYDERTYEALRPDVTPETQTADLTGALLALAAWGAPRAEGLRLPSPLPTGPVREDEAVLRWLGAIDGEGRITARGRRLAEAPVSPRWARALLDGAALVGSRSAAEYVAAAEVGADGDLADALVALRAGRHPLSLQWREEASRLGRLVAETSGEGEPPASTIVLAYPERVARRTAGGAYLLASGTRAAAPVQLTGHEWLAVAEVSRAAGNAASGTGAVIRSGAPISEATARSAARELFVEEVRGELVGGRIRARRVTALGAIDLTSTPVPAADLDAGAVTTVVKERGLGVIGWSPDAEELRRRLAFLHRELGELWPDVSDDALLERLEEWLGPELARAARSGDLRAISLTTPLRRLLPWQVAARLDELAPVRLAVPSGSNIRLSYPDAEHGGRVVCAVKLQECFGLAASPLLADGRVPVQFQLLSPAGRPLAVTDDLASFWSGPYAQVRAEMRGRYPRHPWPEDPWSATATARTKRRS